MKQTCRICKKKIKEVKGDTYFSSSEGIIPRGWYHSKCLISELKFWLKQLK